MQLVEAKGRGRCKFTDAYNIKGRITPAPVYFYTQQPAVTRYVRRVSKATLRNQVLYPFVVAADTRGN